MSIYYVGSIPCSDFLIHYGILGQKWGIRRYQNTDGSLTVAGKERYKNTDYNKRDNIERGIVRKQNKYGRKAGKYEEKAEKRLEKTGNDKGILYNYYKNKAEKYFDAYATGYGLLNTYSNISLKERKIINNGRKFVADDYTLKALKHLTMGDLYKDGTFNSVDYKERDSYVDDVERSLNNYTSRWKK